MTKKETASVSVEPKTASQLPMPKGYRILIALPDSEEKTAGGIIRPEDLRKREETASILGFVLKMGPDCYADESRFASGPYCKEGDWVIFRSYSGTRFKLYGREFRLINDDTVEAVVEDPRGYERA
jgi:co-chaperonin GroES (HSP10)